MQHRDIVLYTLYTNGACASGLVT